MATALSYSGAAGRATSGRMMYMTSFPPDVAAFGLRYLFDRRFIASARAVTP